MCCVGTVGVRHARYVDRPWVEEDELPSPSGRQNDFVAASIIDDDPSDRDPVVVLAGLKVSICKARAASRVHCTQTSTGALKRICRRKIGDIDPRYCHCSSAHVTCGNVETITGETRRAWRYDREILGDRLLVALVHRCYDAVVGVVL